MVKPITPVTNRDDASSAKPNFAAILKTFFSNNNADQLAQALRNQGIQAICFDMDGTLVDTEATNLAIVEKGLATHGISLSPKEQEAYPGSTIKGFAHMILENRRIKDAEAEAQAISDSKLTEFPKLLKAGKINSFPKICNLAQVLKQQGFKIALVTSSMREVMQKVLDHFKLNGYFNITLAREDANGNLKPDPFIYNKATRKLETKSANTLVFEDSGPGVIAAHRAGTNVVVIKNLPEQDPGDIPSDEKIHPLDMTKL